jgi:ankyrin repeat protein
MERPHIRLRTNNDVLSSDDIKEMIHVSNILIDLKKSNEIEIKKKVTNYIICNIKILNIHTMIHLITKNNLSYDITDTFGNTLLMLTCIENNEELFNFLLFNKLNNVNASNNDGYTVLHYIAHYSRTNFLFHFSVNSNNYDTPNLNGDTALHIACKVGNINFIKTFLLFYRNFNIFNKIGKTPILLTIEYKHIKLFKYLLYNQYFDINDSIDTNNNSLLHHACMTYNNDIFDILMENGIKTDLKNKFNYIPIYYAYCMDNRYAFEKLIKKSNS